MLLMLLSDPLSSPVLHPWNKSQTHVTPHFPFTDISVSVLTSNRLYVSIILFVPEYVRFVLMTHLQTVMGDIKKITIIFYIWIMILQLTDDWILCHINTCWLLNAKSYLYIYIKYMFYKYIVCW